MSEKAAKSRVSSEFLFEYRWFVDWQKEMSQMRAVFVSSRFFFDKENGIDGLIQFLGRAPPLSLNVDFCEGYSHFRLEMIWKRLKFSERAPQPVYYGSRFFGPGWAKKTSWIKTFHFCTGLVQKSSFFAVFCVLFIDFISFSYWKIDIISPPRPSSLSQCWFVRGVFSILTRNDMKTLEIFRKCPPACLLWEPLFWARLSNENIVN